MPANVVKSVSRKCDMSMDEVEKKWDEAKEAAADEGHKEEFDYIMSIFKNMVGKECMKKMGWTNESNSVVEKIEKYLNEAKKAKVKYEISPAMDIVGVGFDTNGNWSYWLEVAGKNRAVKVQAEPNWDKITKDDFKSGDINKKTIKEIENYVKKFVMKK